VILLDTHIAIWLASDISLLRQPELDVILAPDNNIAVSAVSIWEVRIKWAKRFSSGDRKGPVDPADLLAALREMNIAVLPLEADHTTIELQVALKHNDPFDHLLLTIAQETGRRLLTRDADLRGHPLALYAE
jgi:PIN domain nuclease of toxin-antitoxin system